MAYFVLGDLALHDKTMCFDADKQSIRDASAACLTRLFQLSRTPDAQAVTDAKQAMAFETRLAKASKSTAELARDTSLYYHPVSLAEADKLTPKFPWANFFKSQGITMPAMFYLSMPAFQQEINPMLSDTTVASWKKSLTPFRLLILRLYARTTWRCRPCRSSGLIRRASSSSMKEKTTIVTETSHYL